MIGNVNITRSTTPASMQLQRPVQTSWSRSNRQPQPSYASKISAAVQALDVGRLEALLDHPPNTDGRFRMEIVNRELPSSFPGACPGDTLLHHLADRSMYADKAARMIAMLRNVGADVNTTNDAGETPAMRATAGQHHLQLIALATTETFNSRVQRPLMLGDVLTAENVWSLAQRTGNADAVEILERAPITEVDRSAPERYHSSALADDVAAEEAPPPYGSNQGVPGEADLAPPSRRPETPPPDYRPAPPYTSRAAESHEVPHDGLMNRSFSTSDVRSTLPAAGLYFRRLSVS